MKKMLMSNRKIFRQKVKFLFVSEEKKKKVIESKMNYNGKMLEVVRCPEPGDIIWKNLNITTI